MRVVLLSLFALALVGCAGYRLGPIKPKSMSKVQTIAVPAFKNDTLLPRLEVLGADMFIRQMQLDGTYRITDSDHADAIVAVTIKKIDRHAQRSLLGDVLTAQEFTLNITLDATVTDSKTGVQLLHTAAVGSSDFFVSTDIQQDEQQALSLALRSAATHLSYRISEGW